ncbi:TfuA-like protein [Hoeflea poritis]|uniref:TfuA-like protein n=1 Tax=Hoeflea poritis TaxID=2993659 RepID=A0ABT4VNV0_9HYPH|nr:TfuA-like protein [Hoeflea poritis]MDA4846392.1 TfuA-like protein [Hoeflea poritis]
MIVVFAGPSLAGERLDRFGGMDFLPPVKQGDLYLAAQDGPEAIGVIDGMFDGVPSVWHKEILWAMSREIPVFGGASMGALRAAELDSFGMTGIGRIYEAYRDGILEDDDEVALQHGPAEAGYAPLSLAMINIRATLDEALRVGRLTQDQRGAIAGQAKAIHFKERTWEAVLAALERVPGVDARDVCAWLQENYIDLKKADALELLARLQDAGNWLDRPVGFHFEHTELWRQGVVEWRQRPDPVNTVDDTAFRLVPRERLFRSAGGED